MLAVDCGSPELTARRALRAATCAGVAWFGVVGASSQKPRDLTTSAGVCELGSVFSTDVAAACFDFPGWVIWTSAEASWKVEATDGFARGIGTGSLDLAGAAAGRTATGGVFSVTDGAP